jgi:hypothetical protein
MLDRRKISWRPAKVAGHFFEIFADSPRLLRVEKKRDKKADILLVLNHKDHSWRVVGQRFILSALIMSGTLTALDASLFHGLSYRRLIDSLVITVFGLVWVLLYFVKPEWFRERGDTTKVWRTLLLRLHASTTIRVAWRGSLAYGLPSILRMRFARCSLISACRGTG